jgi:signal transduction histidine kinase
VRFSSIPTSGDGSGSNGGRSPQGRRGRGNTTLLLAVIIVLAISFSFGTYQYSTYVSNSITSSAVQSTHTDAQIQASNMANVVSNKLDTVASDLQVIADSQSLQQGDAQAVSSVLQSTQNTTNSFTNGYAWINQSGDLMASTNQTGVTLAAQQAINYTARPYFVGAMDAGTTYVTGAIVSLLTHQVQIVVAQPIYSADGQSGREFKGVVTCSIILSNLGELVKSQLAPQFKSSVGLIDANGTILYTNDQNITGINVFSNQFQVLLPVGVRGQFDSFLNASLQAKAGVQDISYKGSSGTIAYQPVLVQTTPDNSTKPEFFGVLYISAANVLAANQAQQISQLRDFTILVMLGIDASAVGGALIVFRWNKSLDRLVRERTADLQERTTELARANQDLVARDEAQKDFLNIAVHELRTPVQPLVILGEMMKESVSEGKTELSQMQVDMVDRSARRLERLTRTLLDLTKIETDTLKLNREGFDLNDEVSKVITEMTAAKPSAVAQPSLSSTGNSMLMVGGNLQPASSKAGDGKAGVRADGGPDHHDGWTKDAGWASPTTAAAPADARISPPSPVRFAPSQDPLPVDADSTRIFEVIANLLRNAQAFSHGREIEVSTYREGGDAVVRVRDHGTGIDPDIMPRLFTKFASKSASGMGLGLYISKELVEAHGGRIWAENNNDGRGGATFSFSLPLAAGEGGRARQVGSEAASSEGGAPSTTRPASAATPSPGG